MDEIHHAALLLRDSLAQIASHEERLQSVRVSPKFEEVVRLLKNALGSQAEKFKRTPDRLDEVVEMAIRMKDSCSSSEPIVVQEVIEFTLPDEWSRDFNRAIRKLKRNSTVEQFIKEVQKSKDDDFGCSLWLASAAMIFIVIQLF